MDEHRNDNGTFGEGNKFSRGAGVARTMAHRAALMRSEITDDEVRELTRSLFNRAKAGSVAAAELLLRYLCGPADHADLVERVEELERRRQKR